MFPLICIKDPRMSEKSRFRSICFCRALLLPRVLRIGWFSQMCYCVTATSCRRQSEEASLSTSPSHSKATVVPLALRTQMCQNKKLCLSFIKSFHTKYPSVSNILHPKISPQKYVAFALFDIIHIFRTIILGPGR